ncbi:MAG: RibD family protein [Thermoplasmatota archaeon]
MERPVIHINCAATVDGKISKPDGSRLRISGEWDMGRVHRLRASLGAVLVGSGTIIKDDPKLTVKEVHVPDPPSIFKVVIDGRGRIPSASRFLRTRGHSIIATRSDCSPDWKRNILESIEDEGLDARIMEFEPSENTIDIEVLLRKLADLGVDGILVEGGSRTIWEFVSGGFFDKFTIYLGPMVVGGNGPTVMSGPGFDEAPLNVKIMNVQETPDGGLLVEMEPSGQYANLLLSP